MTFCPRLFRPVKDSPHPKIFSSCDNRKLAARLRPRSLARRTNEQGTGCANDLISFWFWVRVSSLPALSRNSICQGSLTSRTLPNPLEYVIAVSLCSTFQELSFGGSATSMSDGASRNG